MTSPRLAVRALILHDDRLLLVNAFAPPAPQDALWCAPGGGVERAESLNDALRREVAEETGLTITPGALSMVSQFTDVASGFHQVELFFRATIDSGTLRLADPDGLVSHARWMTQAALQVVPHKPIGLIDAAWATPGSVPVYPMDSMVRPPS